MSCCSSKKEPTVVMMGMDHGPSMNHSMGDSMGGGCGMKMYWNWDQTVDAVFFKEWSIENTTQLVISIFGVFALAALYEGMNAMRTKVDEWLDERARERALQRQNCIERCTNCPCSSNSNGASNASNNSSNSGSTNFTGKSIGENNNNDVPPYSTTLPEVTPASYYEWHEQALRAAIHAIHTFYALFIMMLFMTYNGYLNVALIAGAFSGFMIFQRKRGSTPKKATSCH